MASGTCEENPNHGSRVRIMDILHEPDETCSCSSISGGGEPKRGRKGFLLSASSLSCSPLPSSPSLRRALSKWIASPRKMAPLSVTDAEGRGLSRWLRSFKVRSCDKSGEKEDGEDEDERAQSPPPPSPSASASPTPKVGPEEVGVAAKGVDDISGCRQEEDSGNKTKEDSSNMGICAALVFLYIKSATEFNKMVELRKEMETMLNEFKEIMPRKDVISDSAESKTLPSVCSEPSEHSNSSNYCSSKNHQSTYHASEMHIPMQCESSSNCNTNILDCKPPRIDEMEAEFENELERLQLNLNHDPSDSDAFVEYELEMPGDNGNFSESNGIHFKENSDIDYEHAADDDRDPYSVCPYELERRLHELLEDRQQEQIEELEFTLHCMEEKLREKETEIQLWRDTARLARNGCRKSF